ncbi:hypothetical protein ACHWQZ_G000147 [Mnemiopsis leidyi]
MSQAPNPSSLPEIEQLKEAIEEQDIIKVKKTLASLTNKEQLTEYVNQKIGDDSETLLHIASKHNVEILKYFVELGGDVNGKDKYDEVPLFSASRAGKIECVQYLVSKGGDVQSKDNNGQTPLHLAVISGYIDCVQYLVSKGGDVQSKDNNGETPLHLAVISGNINCVQYLVSKGGDVQSKDNNGYTPLYWAARSGNIHCFQYLVSKGGDVQSKDNNGKTPLHWAARSGNIDCVQYLVSKGGDVQSKDNNGETPLHLAVISGNIGCVQYLVSKGGDMQGKNNDGKTPLHSAAASGNVDCVQYLVSMGLDVQSKDNNGETPLHLAARLGYIDCVQYLVSKGGYVQSKDNNGETPLHLAVISGNIDCVQYLVSKGGDVQSKDNNGETPLHLAVISGNIDCVQYLVSKGGDVQSKDNNGETPLHWAARSGNIDCVQYLVSEGGDVQSKNNNGETPLHLAAVLGYIDCVQHLVSEGGDVQSKDNNGYTPLHLAASYGHIDCVKYLMSMGGDVQSKDNDGETPLHLAARLGYIDCVQYLVSNPFAPKGERVDINATDKMGRTALIWAIEGKMDDISLFLLSQPAIKFNDNIFYIMKDIVRKKVSINSVADFILRKYLCETAVPDQGPPSDIPFTLEKLFDTADEKTSILSELGSIIDDEFHESDTKTICSALRNIVIIGLQRNANHKRLQYLFFKGSVFKQFVQIFVDIKEEIISNEEKHFEQILKILYIATQSNIRCGYEEDKKPNTDINIRSNNADLLDNEANALDKDNESASRNLKKGVNAGLEVPDKKTGQFIKSLQNKLGEDLYGQFRDRIKNISEMKLKGSGEVSNNQLIAKGIYKAHFKPENGCCSALIKSFTDAEDWLSLKIGINKLFHKCTCRGDFAFIFCFVAIFVQASDVYSDARFGFKTLSGFSFPSKAALICSLGFVMWTVGVIVFLTTTKNGVSVVRLPLIITTILILFIFLVVVSVLRFFSEAKQPEEKKNEREDSAMKDKSSEDKSCCLLRVPCCLCCSQDLASTPEEQICSAKSTNNRLDNQEPSQSQIVRVPAILKQRINTYEQLPIEEDIELAPVNNSSENVKL